MRNLTETRLAARLALVLLIGPGAAHATSDMLRCGSHLVGPEATADDVRQACGEPDYLDRWDSPGAQLVGPLSGTEEWYYNFGPSQLLRVVHLQLGRVIEIRSAGYGFRAGGSHRCNPFDIVAGMSKYELVESCGDPESRHAEFVLRAPGGSGDVRLRRGLTQVFAEEWTYNFGTANLMRIVTLENGQVTDVQTGGRGHDSP